MTCRELGLTGAECAHHETVGGLVVLFTVIIGLWIVWILARDGDSK